MELQINGRPVQVDAEPDMPLLWVLRDVLNLTGTKFGCGVAACGACTVHIDGQAVRSCVMPAAAALGIALHESFGSIVAQVVEVSLQDGAPRVHRVVCVIDCGTVVNPNIVTQQLQGAVIFGLTAALYSTIDIEAGRVQQRNFPNYPMVKLAQAPQVESWIVPSERAPGGVGEPGVPPLAPAVGNALFRLTGKRARALPLGT